MSLAGDLFLFEFVWVCFESWLWRIGLLACSITAALSPASPWGRFWFFGM